jgi:putative SOS response-associated peptidase YedK
LSVEKNAMCGRFTLSANKQRLQETFPMFDLMEIPSRYNIAPRQQVLAVRQENAERPKGSMLRWGLLPSWAKEKKVPASLINARSDSVADKPSFRTAFKHRRCLILADGFYEWTKGPLPKQPFHIRRKDAGPFAFAGLWERSAGEEPSIESCTIITTDSNDVVRPFHDRMPVILDAKEYARWLDRSFSDPGVLQEMLRPYPSDLMTTVPVSIFVNNSRNEGAECLAAV